MNTATEAPCVWCEEPTEETGKHFACMLAHCLDCLGRCNACQDDMRQEANL